MADIFGNEPDSYRIVRDLQADGRWDDYQKSQSLLRFGTDEVRHDFGSLGKGHESLNSDQMRASESAQAVGFLTNNTLAIQTFIDNVLYTAYRLPRYVSSTPISTPVPVTMGSRCRTESAVRGASALTGTTFRVRP